MEYIANSRFNPDAKPEVLTATARRLVVVSAGAFGSPAILERSGVGSKEALAKVGVEQFIDLPGVGESYQGQTCRFAGRNHRLIHDGQTTRLSLVHMSRRTTFTPWMVL